MAVVGGAGRSADRRTLRAELLRAVVPDDHPDHGGRRARPEHPDRLYRADLARPCRLSRHRRLCLCGAGFQISDAPAGRLPWRRRGAGARQPHRRRAVAAAEGALSRDHHAGVLLHHQHRDPGSAVADQRRPRHFGAAAGDLRPQLRQRRRLHLSLPRLCDSHAVCHAQHPPQPRRPRLCRDPRQRHRRPRHGHQSARLQAVRLRHLGLHHRPRPARCTAFIFPSSASKAFRSCSRSRRWRS